MKNHVIIFLLGAFLLSSCNMPVPTPSLTQTQIGTSTKSLTATRTPTSTQTSTPTQTDTLPPTATITATPTLTSTLAPTLIPRTPITADNVKDIQLLLQIKSLNGRDIRWSPDGELLAIASDYEIRLFYGNTLKELPSISTDFSLSNWPHIMFSYDGTKILIGGWNYKEQKSVGQVFDVESGQELYSFLRVDEVKDFCQAGEVLLSAYMHPHNNTFCLPPERFKSLGGGEEAFTTDYQYKAETSQNPSPMRLYKFNDKGSWTKVWDTGDSYIWEDDGLCADFSPDKTIMAVGFSSGDIHLYDMPTHKDEYSFVVGVSIEGLSFSPDGTHLAYTSLSGSGVIDISSGYPVIELGGSSPGSIADIAFSPDGRWLATTNDARNLQLWEIDSGKLIGQWPDEPKVIDYKYTGKWCQSREPHLAFSPDGKWVALTRGTFLNLIDLNTDHYFYRRNTGGATSITFSPDGAFIATGTNFAAVGEDTLSQFDWVKLYQASSGVVLHAFHDISRITREGVPGNLHFNCIMEVAFSPDSHTLAMADPYAINFMDTQDGERVWQHFDAKMSDIQDIEFSQNGSIFAAIDMSGRVKLWPIVNGQISNYTIYDGYGFRSGFLSFSPDGSLIGIVYEKDGSLMLDILTTQRGQKLYSKSLWTSFYATHYQVHFSPDGSLLAVGGEMGELALYGLMP